ncbi:hypothetical protein Ddye_026807 [Dipteronia dyeriana]|uniref:HAT C-terminal dimerisation domain-containing protein n=1 Tax=Dipteronia dyeriana TaxID=168575 RepID=A0AAD9TNE7_9ROSI|nr:hypothetical protein Ddye_026807 [Dipteronia dyeriana]
MQPKIEHDEGKLIATSYNEEKCRESLARLQKFKSCTEREKISLKKVLCLDVPTRWNSTYWMLESAEKFQKAFESEDRANEMTSKVISTLNEIYNQYKVIYFANVEVVDNVHIANDISADDGEIDVDSLFDSGYMKLFKETDGVDNKTEVDQYLMESCENPNDGNFDILCWWKIKSPKYKILSYVAQDILAIPVSNVAYESTFSTGGRILDSFRSSLPLRTIETLICTQNWLDSSSQISLGEMVNNME